jgi:hypothetical protein
MIECACLIDLTQERGVETLRQISLVLERENQRLITKTLELTAENARLRGLPDPEQLALAELRPLEQRRAQLLVPAPDTTSTVKPSRPPRPRHGPRSQPVLPVVEIRHELPPDQRACPACGGELTEKTGHTQDSRRRSVDRGAGRPSRAHSARRSLCAYRRAVHRRRRPRGDRAISSQQRQQSRSRFHAQALDARARGRDRDRHGHRVGGRGRRDHLNRPELSSRVRRPRPSMRRPWRHANAAAMVRRPSWSRRFCQYATACSCSRTEYRRRSQRRARFSRLAAYRNRTTSWSIRSS